MQSTGTYLHAGALAILIAFCSDGLAAPLSFVPQTVKQPDGTALHCFASGDEFNNWLHDAAGYTIIQDQKTGRYVYAVRAGERLAPSVFVPGTVDPAAAGLKPWLTISRSAMKERRESFLKATPPAPAAPSVGSVRNLVVFIRFYGEPGFARPLAHYDSMFNASTAGANSMRNYFEEVSYGKVLVQSEFFPLPDDPLVLSYQDSHARSYYRPQSVDNPDGYTGGSDGVERRVREHTLLAEAVAAIAGQVPDSLDLDADDDGSVDNVCFVVSGSAQGWSSLLWPHRWVLWTTDVRINSKLVQSYTFQLDSSMNNGVLCHEMFHSFGAPDLYHYSFDGISPVGSWDLMESNRNPPQHMGAYMKHRYGQWIPEIPELTSPGRYSLRPLTSATDNLYRVPSPNSSTEYFVLEYRKRTGTFEASLPGEGLLVYRINSQRDGAGNHEGPPDEVYLFRPYGTPSANGIIGAAAFSLNAGRVSICDSTDPASFLQFGDPGGLHITDVGLAGDSIAFTLERPISVRFGRFEALAVSPDTVRLTWSTLLERSNAGFEIERSSTEAGEYQPLPTGTIPGNSPSVGLVEYTAVDGDAAGFAYYRVRQTDSTGVVSCTAPVRAEGVSAVLPDEATGFHLSQNYPNPFNPSTEIRFTVGRSRPTSLRVFDVLGRHVATLFDQPAEAGRVYTLTFDATGVASGVYVYALSSGGRREVKRLMVLK